MSSCRVRQACRVSHRTAAIGLAAAPLAATAAWASPAMTRSRLLRTVGFPRLAGRGDRGHVALTFDDGPHPKGTPAVLEALARLDVTATFFFLSAQVRRFPEVAAAVRDAGHELAVHGDLHRNHLFRSPAAVRRDIRSAVEIIGAVGGEPPRWFRPPYGVLTTSSLSGAHDVGLTPVLWTAWGRDWTSGISARRVADTVARQLRPGGTILLHDSDVTAEASGTWRGTVGALDLIASEVDALGCRLGTLGRHFRPDT